MGIKTVDSAFLKNRMSLKQPGLSEGKLHEDAGIVEEHRKDAALVFCVCIHAGVTARRRFGFLLFFYKIHGLKPFDMI